jgi:hypothetical protein
MCLRDHGLHLTGVGDVTPEVGPADLLGSALPGVVVQVDEHDLRAFLGEAARGGETDPTHTAGDDRGAVLQASWHLLSPPC